MELLCLRFQVHKNRKDPSHLIKKMKESLDSTGRIPIKVCDEEVLFSDILLTDEQPDFIYMELR